MIKLNEQQKMAIGRLMGSKDFREDFLPWLDELMTEDAIQAATAIEEAHIRRAQGAYLRLHQILKDVREFNKPPTQPKKTRSVV